MKLLLANAVLCFVLPTAIASAHDQWADGSPVPAWVKAQCCGVNDVHHLKPEQVHRVDGGYLVDGHEGVIPSKDALPSQDGDYWLFGPTDWTDGVAKIGDVRCFFIPVSI